MEETKPGDAKPGVMKPGDGKSGIWTAAVIGTLTVGAIVWAMSDVAPVPAPVAVAVAPSPTAAATPTTEGATPVAAIAQPTEAVRPPPPAAPVVPRAAATRVAVKDPTAPRKPAGKERQAVTPVAARHETKSAQGTAASRRMANDARIRSGVMERLAANRATIYGRIGVESQDAVVRLTGYTQTSGQALRAEREARKVRGVRSVRNEIRPRIGGSR